MRTNVLHNGDIRGELFSHDDSTMFGSSLQQDRETVREVGNVTTVLLTNRQELLGAAPGRLQ